MPVTSRNLPINERYSILSQFVASLTCMLISVALDGEEIKLLVLCPHLPGHSLCCVKSWEKCTYGEF